MTPFDSPPSRKTTIWNSRWAFALGMLSVFLVGYCAWSWSWLYTSERPIALRCVFRTNVTARFGIVTADFGSVTGRSGDVTAGVLAPA